MLPNEPEAQAPSEVTHKAHEVSLTEFIEKNHRTLSALGIFTALTVFASNLQLQFAGHLLGFLFLSLTVLLWLELVARFPSKFGSWRLTWFENGLTLVVFAIVGYWFLEVTYAFPFAIALLGAQVALFLFSALMKKFDLFNQLFTTKEGERTRLRYLLLVCVIGVVYMGSLVVIFVVTPSIYPWIINIREQMVAFSPGPWVEPTPLP